MAKVHSDNPCDQIMADMSEGKKETGKVLVDHSTLYAYQDRIKELEAEKVAILEKQKGMVPMILNYQGYIDTPPVSKEQLWGSAVSNDTITVTSWKTKWLANIKGNVELNDIVGNSAMSEFGKYSCQPVICAGSGPSLKKNAHLLGSRPSRMGLVSCLHNFAYFVDLGIVPDGFVTLDAGDIVIEELSQGGTRPAEYYWEATKDHTLIAALVTPPELIKKWKGKIVWFDAPVPDQGYQDERKKLVDFNVFFNVGGNALGAVYYHARAILGGMPIIFVGADFAFDYTHRFHPFNSPYDQQFRGVIPCTDVFGNRVHSWQSYYNFKAWFDFQAQGGQGNNPVQMINATEGGILGAYPQGNIRHIQQLALMDVLAMYKHHEMLPTLTKGEPGKPVLLF